MANEPHRPAAPGPAEGLGAGEAPRLLHEFFEAQVRLRPEHPALECDDDTLTYAALDRLANGFAVALQARGIGRGDLVALYADKRLWMKLMKNAMKQDVSWAVSARAYAALYASIRGGIAG